MAGHRVKSSAAKPAVPATERVYQAIRHEILSNRLRSGEPVPIKRFVHELRLSRTPVREAILRLQREGLIEVRPRMGTFVSYLDIRRIREMYDLRRLLEGHAANLAVASVAPEAARALRKELAAYAVAGQAVDYKGISESGKKVHGLILDHCGNEALAEMLRSMRDQFARFRSVSLEIPEKVISSHKEHLAILAALEARDGTKAEELVHEHLDHAAELLLESLLQHRGTREAARITIA